MAVSMAFITANAQEQGSTEKPKEAKTRLSVGSGGIEIGKGKNEDDDKAFDVHIGMLDLGINYIDDKTDYASSAVQEFLNVGPEMQNENLFSLRDAKSINVNIYPVVATYRMVNTKNQRIYLGVGIGLQMYNFRFTKSTTYINETVPMVVMDSISFTKNKLAFTYLSMPLMLNFKTRVAKDAWIVYGAGITAGYRIASWTKQVSSERGKQKNHDPFNFNNFNSCATAEIGLDGYFRLYASYQLTALHKDIMDQHPYCIGIRFLGI
jgi:hypothetical protein